MVRRSEMNRLAAQQPFKVSHELFELLAACVDYSRKSEGAFDISVGPLMKVWGFYKGSGHLPAEGAVSDALQTVGYQNIILDSKTRTVRFAQEGVGNLAIRIPSAANAIAPLQSAAAG